MEMNVSRWIYCVIYRMGFDNNIAYLDVPKYTFAIRVELDTLIVDLGASLNKDLIEMCFTTWNISHVEVKIDST